MSRLQARTPTADLSVPAAQRFPDTQFSPFKVTIEDLRVHLDEVSPSLGSTHRLSLVVPNMEYRDSTSEAICQTVSLLFSPHTTSHRKRVFTRWRESQSWVGLRRKLSSETFLSSCST